MAVGWGGLLGVAPLTAFATQSVTLVWNPVVQPEVAGYIVHSGPVSQRYSQATPVNQPTTTITGLVEGTTYFFMVTAVNQLGLESTPSDEVSYTVPLPPAGNYQGLFYEEDGVRPDTAGSFTVSVTAGGTYSGKLQIGTVRGSFSGRLSPQYRATNVVPIRKSSPLSIEISLGIGGLAETISGRVTDGTWVSRLSGHCAAFNSRSSLAPFAGNYTLALPGGKDPGVPMGCGFGTVRVGANGVARLAGVLADGTKVSQSASLSRQGQWPLYAALYSGGGLVISWLGFTNRAGSDLNGTFCWIKPPDPRARYYASGFAQEGDAIGSAYGPATGKAYPVLNFTSGTAGFSGGNLDPGFTNAIVIASGKATSPDDSSFALNFAASQGTFKGKVMHPATGRLLAFSGVVLQKMNAGYGFLLGSNQSSCVVLQE